MVSQSKLFLQLTIKPSNIPTPAILEGEGLLALLEVGNKLLFFYDLPFVPTTITNKSGDLMYINKSVQSMTLSIKICSNIRL